MSGGGDSLALLHLMHEAELNVVAATVDHRLRVGSAEDGAHVARICGRLAVPHVALRRPSGADWSSQRRAREGRYAVLGAEARVLGAPLVIGHTLDDQAETVRMRARRGGGTLGLAGIAPVATLEGRTRLLRPLLGTTRDALRRLLRERGTAWVDDPANANHRFERVRVRREGADEALRDIGRLAELCRRERTALVRAIAADFGTGLRVGDGAYVYRPRLRGVALVHALRWLAAWAGGDAHLPAQGRMSDFVASEAALTVAGAVLRKEGIAYRVTRDPRRPAKTGAAGPFSRFRPASDDPVFHVLTKLAPAT